MATCPFADQSRRYDAAYPMTYSGGAWKALLHGTESPGLPGYDGGAKAPHFTVVPNKTTQTVKVYQHFDTARPSRALRNLSGGVETNRERVIQIEITGTSDPRAAGAMILLSAAPRWLLDGLARLMRWIEDAHGIPSVSTPRPWLPYPSSYGATRARMTGPEWESFSGWCGHQHAPENAHGDPGDIDITYLLAPTTSKEDIMATLDELRAVIRAEIMDAPVTRAGGLEGETSLRTTLAWLDSNLATAKDTTRITAAVTAAVAAIAPEVSASALAAEIIKQLAAS